MNTTQVTATQLQHGDIAIQPFSATRHPLPFRGYHTDADGNTWAMIGQTQFEVDNTMTIEVTNRKAN